MYSSIVFLSHRRADFYPEAVLVPGHTPTVYRKASSLHFHFFATAFSAVSKTFSKLAVAKTVSMPCLDLLVRLLANHRI